MRALGLALALLLLSVRPLTAADDQALVETLKKALRRGEVAERIEALRQVERRARDLPPERRRAAAVAVTKALPDEAEAAVKAAMVRTLSRLGGATGWVPILLAWRSADADTTLRAAARQALLWGGGDYLLVVERLLKEDEDATFRADLLLLLGDRRKSDAVALLLDTLASDEHPRAQSAAAEALEAITGEAWGLDVGRWRDWWAQQPSVAPGPPPPEDDGGEVVTVAGEAPEAIPEPPRHVTRSLLPRFYDLAITAKDVVFVLDISGSIGSGGVGRAKRELVQAVERLGSDVHIAALFFDEQVRMWKPEMVPATPANKAALAHFLRGIEPGRRTDVMTPLHAGLQIVRRRVEALQAAGTPIREAVTLIVVSDGVETSASTPPHVVEEKLARLDPQNTVVHVVALGERPSPILLELARRGGGHYVTVR